MLSDSDSDDGALQNNSGGGLTGNKSFAMSSYEARKGREELSKARALRVDLSDDSDGGESSETEDEDGEALTSALDAKICRLFCRLWTRRFGHRGDDSLADPHIYDAVRVNVA